MSELRELLEREAVRVSAEPRAFDTVLRRVDRRHRNRRVRSAVVALLLAIVAIGSFIRAFERAARQFPVGPPQITEKNVADLRLAWTASPGGCCPLPSVSGGTVYVGWNDGITAYPAYCATGGATCKPIWVGKVSGHPPTTIVDYKADHLWTPVVGDGMVFSVDQKHLYAFPVDCATEGHTCQPSWVADPATRNRPLAPPVVAGGLVFIGTGTDHLYGYPTHCATGAKICEPSWVAKGGGQPAVSDGVVFGKDSHHVYAYPVDCGTSAGGCPPLWVGELPQASTWWNIPRLANGSIYIPAGNSVFAFPTSCGTGGATCRPAWIGATGEPGGGIISLAADDGMVFASTTQGGAFFTDSGHIYAFSTSCGRSVCKPVWSVKLGADSYVAARNGLLFVATHGGFLAAYPERCDANTAGCKPLWTIATFDRGFAYVEPIVTDRAVYSGGDAGRIYSFTVPSKEG